MVLTRTPVLATEPCVALTPGTTVVPAATLRSLHISGAHTPRLASCDQLNAAAAALNSTLGVAGGWTAAVLACPNAAVVSVVRSPLQRILHRTRHLRQPGARCAAAAGGTAHGATLHCTAAADGV